LPRILSISRQEERLRIETEIQGPFKPLSVEPKESVLLADVVLFNVLVADLHEGISLKMHDIAHLPNPLVEK